jgi:predicted metal-dependent hydrolase
LYITNWYLFPLPLQLVQIQSKVVFLKQKYASQITVNGQVLPVEIVIEPRRGSRFSIGKKKVLMRLSLGITNEGIQQELARLQAWVTEVSNKRPSVLGQFAEKDYQTGQTITVGQRSYILEISEEERGSHTARMVGNTIALRLSNKANGKQRQKAIQTLLSRVVAGDQYNEVATRVHAINSSTFNRPITNIYLKYNHSNWGSCSSGGNVNLSTRLLFAPPDVQDYVILHELAHLVEMNHSDRFWALVERYMPNYAEKEKWLKTNGDKCHF